MNYFNNKLKIKVKYSGLILTADLSMGAIKKYIIDESESVLAVKAGNDIMITGDYDILMKLCY